MKQLQPEADDVFYGKMPFPVFWYDSNAVWGTVRSMEDLREKCEHQVDRLYGALSTKDEFLDQSLQDRDGALSFGTRSEHRGEKTLRQFLLEHDVDLSNF